MPTLQARPPAAWRWNKNLYYQMAEMGWFQDRRVELIDGEIIEMAPIGSAHWTAVNLASQRLRDVFGAGFVVSVQSSLDLGMRSEPMPDIAVVAGDARAYREALPKSAVLVVEVADTSLSYDRSTKASLYASAGMPEYWIVNLVDRQVEMYRGPSGEPARPGYASVSIAGPGQRIAPLGNPAASIPVDDLLP